MNVLIVYAHPEPRSLNGALKNFAVQRLKAAGHTVQVSDLYSMRWKAPIDASDSLNGDPERRFDASQDSRWAFASGLQSPDISAEQDKLRWADALILQFPLWWFSMPAILKGWVDRVYAYDLLTASGSTRMRVGATATAKVRWWVNGPCWSLPLAAGIPTTARAALTARWMTCYFPSITAS